MSKVDVKETLLKQYSDKELIEFVTEGIGKALRKERSPDADLLPDLLYALKSVERYHDILAAVNARMNNKSKDPVVVV